MIFFLLFLTPIFSQQEIRDESFRKEIKPLESRLIGKEGNDRLQVLVELTRFYRNKDLGKALVFGREALALMREIPQINTKKLVDHLVLLSRITYSHGEYKSVLEYAGEVITLSKSIGDRRSFARGLLYTGRGNKYLANYDVSINYMMRAKDVYQKLGLQSQVASCLNDIGLIYRRLNNYTKALEFILKAGEIFEQLDQQVDTAMVLNNVGIIYLNMGDTDTALSYFKRSQSIDTKLNNLRGLSIVQSNIAEIYDMRGRHDEALVLLKNNLAWEQKLGQKKRVSNILTTIGLHYKRKKEFKRAVDYLMQSKKIKQEINEYFGITEARIQLGAIYTEMGKFEGARLELDTALAMAVKIKSPVFKRDAYLQLSALYEKLGKHNTALDYYKKFDILDDNLFNQKSRNRLTQMQISLGIERKEKEISLLKKDKEIQQLELKRERSLNYWLLLVSILILTIAFVTYTRYQLKVKVTRALEESEEKFRTLSQNLAELVEERTGELKAAQKELVRKERLTVLGQLTATVAHEVRTPLAAVRSSVFSIEKAMENNKPQRIPHALQLAERNIVRCDKIVDDLLNFTRLKEVKLIITHMDQWLNNLLDERTIPDGIGLIREIQPGVRVAIDRERLMRALINVFHNAIYAMQNNDKTENCLTVTMRINRKRLEIIFRDTGTGIDADVLDNIFEPLFTTKRFGFGLGLPVVRNIMSEHHGSVEVSSEVSAGTTVMLWMPVENTNL